MISEANLECEQSGGQGAHVVGGRGPAQVTTGPGHRADLRGELGGDTVPLLASVDGSVISHDFTAFAYTPPIGAGDIQRPPSRNIEETLR